MKRAIYVAVCCLALAGSLCAQDIDQRVATLEARGMYDEALALCLREADVTPVAHYFIGDYYFHGRKGVMRDEGKGKAHYLKALKGLRPLAEQGDAVAQYRVARCLEFGKKDLGAARAWYGRAAEGGNAKAMCRYVILAMQDNPYGEPPAYLERAIELGEPDAMAWRGVMLVERKETRTEGVALLREAAERGSDIALARLAALHFTGEAGVGQDMGMAVKLLQDAVDKGFSEGIAPLDMVRDEYERRVTAQSGEHRAGQPVRAMRPGNGYPGRLAPYAVTPQLDDHLQRYTLANIFVAALVPVMCLPIFAFVYSFSCAPSFSWHLKSSALRLLWIPSLPVLVEICRGILKGGNVKRVHRQFLSLNCSSKIPLATP